MRPGETWHEVPGGMVCASSFDRDRLDETDTTAERCEVCLRWTLDKRPASNGEATVTICGDCFEGWKTERA